MAKKLSQYFDRVEATDISDNQLKLATQSENVNYSRQAAEHTEFKSFSNLQKGCTIIN